MTQNDSFAVPDVKALVAFGKVGVAIISSRMLSLLALFGLLALCGYTIYTASWQGAVVCGIFAWAGFLPALRAESAKKLE